MERMLSRLWEDGHETWFGGSMTPSLDILETATSVEAKLDRPGVKPEEIDIQVNGNLLAVNGERKEDKKQTEKTSHRIERRVGSFSRSITLPCAVQEDEIVADYHHGALTIRMPKSEVAKVQKIADKS